MLKKTVSTTCDGHRYSSIESRCDQEIDSGDAQRCIAIETESSLTFTDWDETTATNSAARHFHARECARNYLSQWLEAQRAKPSEAPHPTEYVGDIPAITTKAGGAL